MAGPKGKGNNPRAKKSSPTAKGPATTRKEEEKPDAEEIFTKLKSYIENSELKKIVKLSNEILKHYPGDEDAVRSKVVALIQDGMVKDAITAIKEEEDAGRLKGDFSLEKSYCLYKQGNHSAALAVINGHPNSSPALLQLKAQVLYRLGRHGDCISVYGEVEAMEGLSTEMKTNILAAFVGEGKSQEVHGALTRLQVSPRDSFDVAFNTACALIEGRQFREAEEMLLLARRVGQEALMEEDFSEAEVEEELTHIQVQLAYVQQCLGRSSEALDGYISLLSSSSPPSDLPSLAVAVSNALSLRGSHGRELFDSLKRMEAFTAAVPAGSSTEGTPGAGWGFVGELESRLSAAQKSAMAANHTLLLLHANKLEQAKQRLSTLEAAAATSPSSSSSSSSSAWLVLLRACLLVREGKPGEALSLLSAATAAEQPKAEEGEAGGEAEGLLPSPVLLLLHLAQTAVGAGELGQAAAALQGLPAGFRNRAAVVATLLDLKQRLNTVAEAEPVLDSAIAWQKQQQKQSSSVGGSPSPSPSAFESMLLSAAQLKLQLGHSSSAMALYESLVSASGCEAVRAEALAGLVQCVAEQGTAGEENLDKYEALMGPIPEVASMDVNALEKASNLPSAYMRAKRPTDGKAEGQENVAKEKKRKRKRKIIYPKGYDPANPPPPPDPERWLPKRERSTYKPKRRDKRSGAHLRGAQGSMAQDQASEVTDAKGTMGGKGTKGAKKAASAPPPVPAALSGKKKGKKGRR